MKKAEQIFHFFPGTWKIERNILSQTPHENIIADGYATFTLCKDDLNVILYSEKVTIQNVCLNTSNIGIQQYEYQYDKASSSVSKYFKDGRFFYTLNILEHQIGGMHMCVSDKYLADYVFGDGQFTLTYSVSGPSKCYKIITVYTAIPS